MDFVLNKIDKHLDNHRSLDQHRKDLKRKLEELNGLKEDTKSIMRSELQPRKKLKAEVQIWLENVERVNGEVQVLDGRIGESSALTRGFHTEDVSKSITEVEELIIQHGKFNGGLVVDNPQWIGQVLSTTSLSGEAVKACIEDIWNCLMDDEVPKIGVWGMGGVGKTSIMKVINNQLLKETGKFDIVIWITVSKEMNVAKLQKDIASKIGVEFSGDEDETTRAGRLFETLSQKSRFMMILDDLWEKVSLERIGIPEPSNGTKLVLTTRSADVCRQMGCRMIKVKPLTEEEAWKLFLEKAGCDILNIPAVEPIARSVAKHCAGLPLGVITIASCMKGIDDISEWRNALNELSLREKSVNGFEDEVFQQLQFSYDRLKNPKLQDCFLSCALYPEDWKIEERSLIQLWIAEGLVEEMDSMRAGFDRGRAIMNRLISNCLLEVFADEEHARSVKMHDLLRDMALRTAKSRFLVKAGMMLEKAPDVQEWSMNLEKVSFIWNQWLYIPLEMSPPKCPRLTTLLLSHCNIASIPDGFLKHMHGLRIIDLSGNPIKKLPISLSKCPGLTTLLLCGCRIESIPESFFDDTNELKILDLSSNPIKSLPHSLSNLKNLTSLLLAYYLIVGETLINGKEVGGLKKLQGTLEGRFYDWHNLNMYLEACRGREEPRQYIIYVGDVNFHTFSENEGKEIVARRCNIYNYQIVLPREIEGLVIGYCNVDCIVLPKLCAAKFTNAQCRKCKQLEEIITSEVETEERGMVITEFHLPQLRQLRLAFLPELKSICSAGGVLVCDSLVVFEIVYCPKLKRMGLNLPKLDNVPPSAFASASANFYLSVRIRPKEWWESVEWDGPQPKSLFDPFVRFW
ncbi:hypothetical protein F3Y22_tig00009009pilonHSYRG00390 [Hibiscus syriacus]|uniref:Uncharacterized protein n=1 Tax=Hibiscus syriacus TaxID=106335 RepID=A0A6A3CBU1_HIBSY|nr:hypothetical protein F3Y22_tig00009009pilonHSYRG00390 [Hibiscus syriacus]